MGQQRTGKGQKRKVGTDVLQRNPEERRCQECGRNAPPPADKGERQAEETDLGTHTESQDAMVKERIPGNLKNPIKHPQQKEHPASVGQEETGARVPAMNCQKERHQCHPRKQTQIEVRKREHEQAA